MQKVSVSSRMKRVLFRKIAICLGFTSNSKGRHGARPFPEWVTSQQQKNRQTDQQMLLDEAVGL
jgi:hypothetical protein